MSRRRDGLSNRIRRIVIRDGPVCQLCGELVNLRAPPWDVLRPSVDHIIPKSKGGSDDLANLQLAHADCNSRRGNEDIASVQLHVVPTPPDLRDIRVGAHGLVVERGGRKVTVVVVRVVPHGCYVRDPGWPSYHTDRLVLDHEITLIANDAKPTSR